MKTRIYDISVVRYNVKTALLTTQEIGMLTTEMKRQVFLKLRAENYRASLRLEGLAPRVPTANKPATKLAALKTKHVR